MSEPWTDEMDARLKQLRIDGMSYAEIGLTMKISRNAAVGRAHRLRGKGVAIAATVPPSYHIKREGRPKPPPTPRPERKAKPKAAPKPRVIRTAADNRGEGVWNPKGDGPCNAWRVVSDDVWNPLDGSTPVPLVFREARQCAWPVDGQGADLMACGEPVQTGSSYCGAHHRMAWIPLKTPQKHLARHVEWLAARC
jgi:GcrA cell cycle regulator